MDLQSIYYDMDQYIRENGVEKGVVDIGKTLKMIAEKQGKSIAIYFVDIEISDNQTR